MEYVGWNGNDEQPSLRHAKLLGGMLWGGVFRGGGVFILSTPYLVGVCVGSFLVLGPILYAIQVDKKNASFRGCPDCS